MLVMYVEKREGDVLIDFPESLLHACLNDLKSMPSLRQALNF